MDRDGKQWVLMTAMVLVAFTAGMSVLCVGRREYVQVYEEVPQSLETGEEVAETPAEDDARSSDQPVLQPAEPPAASAFCPNVRVPAPSLWY